MNRTRPADSRGIRHNDYGNTYVQYTPGSGNKRPGTAANSREGAKGTPIYITFSKDLLGYPPLLYFIMIQDSHSNKSET